MTTISKESSKFQINTENFPEANAPFVISLFDENIDSIADIIANNIKSRPKNHLSESKVVDRILKNANAKPLEYDQNNML
jgi:hypothetical protein